MKSVRFSEAELAFIMRCAISGMTTRQATAALNQEFATARRRETVIAGARHAGAPFGRVPPHPHALPRPGKPSRPPRERSAAYTGAFYAQPAILCRRCATDFARRADEPEPRGPEGTFGRGCKWIHGDPRSATWRQCGARRVAGSAYCAHHAPRTVRAGDERAEAPARKQRKTPALFAGAF